MLISEPDRGVYDAMNKGIQRATGDIIGIINSDDWYNDAAFQLVEQTFSANPDISILYSPINNYFEDRYLNTFAPGQLDRLIFKFTINHPSCFVRRSVYAQVGKFDLSYRIAADYDFILRAYQAGFQFHCVDNALVSYSLNGMSGNPFSKFKQIRESWRVGASAALHSQNLQQQRFWFYLNWTAKEAIVLPIKLVVKPQVTRQLKAWTRQMFGGLQSDKYGAW
jgi:glycosyltransferase involved in cell wall biosynthesis